MTSTDLQSSEDELLAIRCQLGERAAFDDLIAQWHGPLWGFIRRLVTQDDTAQEVVQDVWLRVLRGISRLRDPRKLRAWLFGIARRAVMDRLRQQYADARSVEVDADEIVAESGDTIDDLVALDRALEQLPLLEREVITLFYFQELSLSDIAEALKIPVGTVKSRLFRGRRLLRQRLTAEG